MASKAQAELFKAAQSGNAAGIRAAVAAGADVNAADRRIFSSTKGYTALEMASARGHVEAVEALLQSGAMVNPMHLLLDANPLFLAVMYGHAGVAEVLVRAGADVEKGGADSSQYHWSPLQFAAGRGQTRIVEALVKAGADIHSTSLQGHIPLTVAVLGGHAEVVRILLEAGSNASWRTDSYEEETPLLIALRKGHTGIVKLLLGAGANPNQEGESGVSNTPLQVAAEKGNEEAVAELLKAGADPNLPGWGGTPLGAARRVGASHVVKLLLEAEAKE